MAYTLVDDFRPALAGSGLEALNRGLRALERSLGPSPSTVQVIEIDGLDPAELAGSIRLVTACEIQAS